MNKLKELRQEKKLTQQELADIVGVSKLTILRWEKGDRQIKPDKAQTLADYFGVSVGYLLGYEEFYRIENEALESSIKFNRLVHENADLTEIISEYQNHIIKIAKWKLSLLTDTSNIPFVEQNIIDFILEKFYEEQHGEYNEEKDGLLEDKIRNTYIALGKLPTVFSDFFGSFLTLSTEDKKSIMNLVNSLHEKEEGNGLAEEYTYTSFKDDN